MMPDAITRKLMQNAGIDRLSVLNLAVELVRRGGTVSLVGDGDPLGVDTFATHHVPLVEAPEAYELFQKKEDGAFEVVFKP